MEPVEEKNKCSGSTANEIKKLNGEMEEITKALALQRVENIALTLKKIAHRMQGEGPKYTIIITDEEDKIGIFIDNSEGKCTCMEAETIPDTLRYTIKLTGRKYTRRTVIKAAAIAKRRTACPGEWSACGRLCITRVQALIKNRGLKGVDNDYAPCLYEVTREGTITNIQQKYIAGIKDIEIENTKKKLDEILGRPAYGDMSSPEKLVICDQSVEDAIILKKIVKLGKYILTEKAKDEEKEEIFKRVVQKVAKTGSPDQECLNMLREIDKRRTDINRSKYRLGAFLANANVFVEFTHLKGKHSEIGWFPLSYKTNSRGRNVLVPIKTGEVDRICMDICGTQFMNLQPRILCFLKDTNGKRVINGQIYDTAWYRARMAGKIATYANYRIIPFTSGRCKETRQIMLDKTAGKRAVGGGDHRKGMTDKNTDGSTPQPPLPITVMIEGDKWEELKRNRLETGHKESDFADELDVCENGDNTDGDIDSEIASSIQDHTINEIRDIEDENINHINKEEEQNVNSRMLPDTRGGNIPEVVVENDDVKGKDQTNRENINTQDKPNSEEHIGGKDRNKADGETINEAINDPNSENSNRMNNIPKDDLLSENGNTKYGNLDEKQIEGTVYKNREQRDKHAEPNLLNKITILKEICKDEIHIVVRAQTELLEKRKLIVNIITEQPQQEEISNREHPLNTKIKAVMEDRTELTNSMNTNKMDNNQIKVKENRKIGNKSILKWMLNAEQETNEAKEMTQYKENKRKLKSAKSEVDLYNIEMNGTNNWNGITAERLEYRRPQYDIRNITVKEKERLIKMLRKGTQRTREIIWLNLTKYIGERERWTWGISDDSKTWKKDNAQIAIGQFYKGAIGKSYATLMGRERQQNIVREEQIIKYFPRNEDEKKIDLLPARPSGTKLITTGEIKTLLQSGAIPNGKAAGITGLSYEVIKKVMKRSEAVEIMAEMYNEWLYCPQKIHPQFQKALLVGIPKSDGGIRPLCIQECLIKILNKILMDKIMKLVRDEMRNIQKCLERKEGQIVARDQILCTLENGAECVVQFDFRNAFGTISRKQIIKRLIYYKVETTVINYIITMLNAQKVVFEDNNDRKEIEIQTGVLQGEPLSMVLFAVGIDALLKKYEEIDGVTVKAYADDIMMVIDKAEQVQNTIKAFEEDAKSIGLELNMSKSQIGVISEETGKKIDKKGIEEMKIVELDKECMTFVGLPVTTNRGKEIEHVRRKIEKYVEDTKALWEKHVPIQMRYHIQRACIDPMLDYILKATHTEVDSGKEWIKKCQGELDKTWSEITEISKTHYRRLPVRFYGLGLFNIKDRKTIMRRQLEARDKNTGTDVALEYYKNKVRQWIIKKKIPELNIEAIESRTNASIAMAPNERTFRLSDDAFKIMIALRYNTEALDQRLEGIKAIGRCVCRYHTNTPLTLQHVISCPYIGAEHAIEQHERIAQVITGILMKNKNVTDVIRETYTERQRRAKKDGEAAKRADIVFKENGKEYGVDVSVTSSNNNVRGNNVIRAKYNKEREYNWERNVQIVLINTAGSFTQNSWEFMRKIGATLRDARIIQKILYECTSKRVQKV